MNAKEVFGRLVDAALSNSAADMVKLYADDVVVENPFASDPAALRVVGARTLGERLTQAMTTRRFTKADEIVVHETADPDKVVVELRLMGEITDSGETFDRRHVMIITTKDGKITSSRDYSGAVPVS